MGHGFPRPYRVVDVRSRHHAIRAVDWLRHCPVVLEPVEMTICAKCRPWCAKTEEQLKSRLMIYRGAPEPNEALCDQCGSNEWITTRDYLEDQHLARDLIVNRNFMLYVIVLSMILATTVIVWWTR